VPATLRPAAFIGYWVRKEAALKAVGDGLRTPMTDVEVSAPDTPPRITSWRGRPDLARRLRLHDLVGAAGYRAAVAVVDSPPVPVVATTVERSPRPPYWRQSD
jgi:4'-phosphopantetheinyl transferase